MPAPYEKTVSYGKGTKLGPAAILKASHQVEFYDEETQREIFLDQGVATLKPLSFKGLNEAASLQSIYKVTKQILDAKKFPVVLGGEHMISQGVIKAFAEKYPNLSVLHIDAHSDLRMEYEGNKYSHASVMARVCEIIDPKRLVQIGVRAQCIEEAEYAKSHGVHTFYAYQIRQWDLHSPTSWQEAACEALTDAVYVSFDVDGFDPSIMPATGTPEPNGLFWDEVMRLLKLVGQKKKIVGCDVVEFAPIKGLLHADMTVARLVSKILNYAV
jgi:agmatinase